MTPFDLTCCVGYRAIRINVNFFHCFLQHITREIRESLNVILFLEIIQLAAVVRADFNVNSLYKKLSYLVNIK